VDGGTEHRKQARSRSPIQIVIENSGEARRARMPE